MTKIANGLAIALLAALLMITTYAVFPVKAAARSDVDIQFYPSHEAAYLALKAGEVDFIQWSVTYEQRLDVEADDNLAIAGYSENGMMEFDLNNNYTVPMQYAGVRNPVNVKEFRQALSCAVDKYHIVNFILKGAAGVLNVPIPLNSISWWPNAALPGNYPWEYNMTKAAELLTGAGFEDLEPDGILNYPADWPGRTGRPNMDPIRVMVRTEDKRLDAGRYFCDQLTLLHIPYIKDEGTSSYCYPIVMGDRNYHVYTGGWSLGRYPTFLYPGFHSDFYFPDGSNYVTGMNSSNLPNYPDYDQLAYDVYYTDSIATCQVAAKAAAYLGWVEYVFNIPLWSYNSYVAWQKTMPGVVNEFGYGYDNMYQFLNAYSTDGLPIRMGTIADPKSLNPIYATWYYDYAVLDRSFTALMAVNPYDLAIDQPAAAQDWEVSTWIDPNPGAGEDPNKTKLTYYLKTNIGIVNSTGAYERDFNAYDVAFSCWYTYIFDDGWNWADYQDVHHTKVVDAHTIEIYFDSSSYWFYTAPQYPLFARDELIDQLCTTSSVTFTVGALGTNAWFKLPTLGEQIVDVIIDDLPVDYHICAGYEDYEHNWIWLPDGLAAGTYTIDYYTDDLDPHGFYLAGLPWTDTWYSFGAFYPISITTGPGGVVAFSKNPDYWLPDPPLAEVDWIWVWDTDEDHTPGPWIPGCDSGYYEITIFDVVRTTVSYGHYGYGPYDPQYLPGADLDNVYLGFVTAADLACVLSHYGEQWAVPP